jgi:hypothetical protein
LLDVANLYVAQLETGVVNIGNLLIVHNIHYASSWLVVILGSGMILPSSDYWLISTASSAGIFRRCLRKLKAVYDIFLRILEKEPRNPSGPFISSPLFIVVSRVLK